MWWRHTYLRYKVNYRATKTEGGFCHCFIIIWVMETSLLIVSDISSLTPSCWGRILQCNHLSLITRAIIHKPPSGSEPLLCILLSYSIKQLHHFICKSVITFSFPCLASSREILMMLQQYIKTTGDFSIWTTANFPGHILITVSTYGRTHTYVPAGILSASIVIYLVTWNAV